MTGELLSSEELDEVLQRVCCGGECKAQYDPDEQGICSKRGYLLVTKKIVTDAVSDADAMLKATLKRYGAANP